MEGRLRRFLLTLAVALLLSGNTVMAEELNEDSQLKPVMQPEIERREFSESLIDTEDFEVSVMFGLLSIEDFGANSVIGAKLAYHITEDLFVETTLAQSKAGQTSFEILSGGSPLLTSDERNLQYYNLSLGFNLLPGEAFLTGDITYNTALYILMGMGNTEFAGAERFTLNYGFGYRFLASDYFSVRAEARDHVFNMDVLGVDEVTHNLEFTLGLSLFF